jgi:polynucleotide 5'-kinase involved in rRNA processing
LGIAKAKEADKLKVITPVQAKVDSIEFGSVMVDTEKGEIHEASL